MKDSMGAAQHNPNAGENQVHYSGASADASGPNGMDAAGVTDGLGSIAKIDVKNAETVTTNQRPVESHMKTGAFTI